MRNMPSSDPHPLPPADRRVYCNRTLNLRAIKAVGFDMDYTLVHYAALAWEERAYKSARDRLARRGWPVAELKGDLSGVCRGLVLDLKLGNLVKASRFGYVVRAQHGTLPLDFEEQHRVYSRTPVDLADLRWACMNTQFSLSEMLLYTELVDLLDAGRLDVAIGYQELYAIVRESVDAVHVEGVLKAEVAADPSRFVEADPELALALLDLKHAGKQLFVITNSEWPYTSAMLSHAFDAYLPNGQRWSDLFDLVIVGARKPEFFRSDGPVFQVVDDSGLLRPHLGRLAAGKMFLGGGAAMLERDLGLSGEEILYVGDHVYSDVRVSKERHGWRTALIIRELEDELKDVEAFAPRQAELVQLMQQKSHLEYQQAWDRLELQRLEVGYGTRPSLGPSEIRRRLHTLKNELIALDGRIAPLAREAGELGNRQWGPLMRAGNDKSLLAHQIERSADLYMSRVSNLLYQTPFVYLRAPRGTLPHDPGYAV
jgi:HAD superfamily 5'-nucleotidase-like hydrolase